MPFGWTRPVLEPGCNSHAMHNRQSSAVYSTNYKFTFHCSLFYVLDSTAFEFRILGTGPGVILIVTYCTN
jgi:hypothetical protein